LTAPNPRCRIGRIKPRLSILRHDNVDILENYEAVQDVIADMINVAATDGVRAYAIVSVDNEGRVDRNVVIRRGGARHALLGGMTAMVHDLAYEMMVED